MADDDTAQLQHLLDCFQRGDETARDALIRHSCDRLQRLTRKMLRSYPRLRRWEQTDDVFQNAMLRLHRSLSEVKPGSVPEYLGLAATQIRRSLIDLARHHFRAKGDAAHHQTDDIRCERGSLVQNQPDESSEPKTIEQWSNFHEHIECLPTQEREVFNLLWYQGLEQAEAARVLGVDARTIRRRWRSARMMIIEAMGGEPPE
jgi:RNA polymerase sigma-70 factor (ECF subfamily)